MYRIVKKEALKPTVTLYEIEAPMVAKKAEPGQFIILRVDENGERIPITIHDFDREKGTVTIIVQTIGATTEKLRHKAEGEYIQDFVGPLGRPTETEGKKKVCVVGGGVGCAIALPIARELHERFYKGWYDVKLPHKFKIAVGGCPNNCVKPDLNDLGIIGQRIPNFDKSRCKGCTNCLMHCPTEAIRVRERKRWEKEHPGET